MVLPLSFGNRTAEATTWALLGAVDKFPILGPLKSALDPRTLCPNERHSLSAFLEVHSVRHRTVKSYRARFDGTKSMAMPHHCVEFLSRSHCQICAAQSKSVPFQKHQQSSQKYPTSCASASKAISPSVCAIRGMSASEIFLSSNRRTCINSQSWWWFLYRKF